MTIKRRIFLQQFAASATFALTPIRAIIANPTFQNYPFSLGIASGDPTDQSVILWTRIAPEPLAPRGGMTDTAVPVRWQVAKDRNFRKSVQTGTAVATPEVWATRMRGLDSVATKESNISDVAKFRITAGSVGATLIE